MPQFLEPRDAFDLAEGQVHLNHGSFGAVPRVVAARQDELQQRQRTNFHQFYDRQLFDELESSRVAVSDWLGADQEGFVFTANASAAVATALNCVEVRPGDRVVTTDREYPSTYANLRRLCRRTDAELVVVEVAGLDDAEVVDRIVERVGPRTAAVVVSLVTSPWSTLLPVQPLHEAMVGHRAVLVVDGAHAPGLLDVDLGALHSAFFAVALHKWACFPAGVGGLFVPAEHRDHARPVVDATFADAPRMADRFAWSGTRDYSGVLVAPEVIDVHRTATDRGWTASAEKLAGHIRDQLTEVWPDAVSISDPRVRRMLAWRLPAVAEDDLKTHLRDRGIWTWLGTVEQETVIRVSAAWYNTVEDAERLMDGLATFRKAR
jgi:isopenicillin-N epimerase